MVNLQIVSDYNVDEGEDSIPKFNLFRKMLAIIVILMVPIILLYSYSIKTSTDVLRAELEQSSRDQLKFFQQQMDTTIQSISLWPNLLIYDPDISNLKDKFDVTEDYLDLETIELVKRIQKKLSIQENSVNWVSKLRIYSPALERVITSSSVYSYRKAEMKKTLQNSWQASMTKDEDGVIEYIFTLRTVSPYSNVEHPNGANLIIEVEFSSRNMVRMLDSFRGDGQHNPFIYMDTGEFVFDTYSEKELMNELISLIDHAAIDQSAYQIESINDESYLIIVERSTTTGWMLIDYLPLSEMMRPIEKTNTFFYASVFTLLLMAISVVYLLYVQVQVPIKQLVISFQKLKNEDYSVRLKPKGNTEFTFLFNRFNSMVSQIQALFKKSYLEQIHIREAKLKQLQSQINPHFFYNCFSFISSMAKLENYSAIIAMSQNLSDYYRYTTRQEKELVTITEELEFVRNYLDIGKMRMNRIEYDIKLAPWLKHEHIPPLVVQPLVENAVLHGIERSADSGRIVVTADEQDGWRIITVEDDGKGMQPDEMLELERSLHYPMHEDMGCGLWNVHQRMFIRYGKQAGITLSRSTLGGLCVTIKWQAEVKHEQEE